jgi:hypothetical protein
VISSGMFVVIFILGRSCAVFTVVIVVFYPWPDAGRHQPYGAPISSTRAHK